MVLHSDNPSSGHTDKVKSFVKISIKVKIPSESRTRNLPKLMFLEISASLTESYAAFCKIKQSKALKPCCRTTMNSET